MNLARWYATSNGTISPPCRDFHLGITQPTYYRPSNGGLVELKHDSHGFVAVMVNPIVDDVLG